MMSKYVYIPFDRKFYNDIIRFSDGQLDPVDFIEDQVYYFIERNLYSHAFAWFGDRLIEFAKIHFEHHVEKLEAEFARGNILPEMEAPLVWKEVTISSGTDVRMQYGGSYHFARVKNGKIEDQDGRFSPSEWASKVANGTNRNAWRDLDFRLSHNESWISASHLRVNIREVLNELGNQEI
ncbi:MAG: hypothetical protein OXD45_14900 [Rhodobacteraceae bacterium]|nr:hypothetical protein [Paracoccaceae bacterium]MCY4306825.1 hypothetical protein [Paracoccaceae bacterium]